MGKEKPKLRVIKGNEKPIPERVLVEPVHFKEWDEKGLLGIVHRKQFPTACWHNSKVIDPDSRMVRCNECESYLDPYDVLSRLVRDRENMNRTNEEMRDEINRLSEIKSEMKKELKSLEGKIKRRKAELSKPKKKLPLFKDWN